MKEYLHEVSDVLNECGTSKAGLESSQITQRLEKYGTNKLKEGKKESFIHRFAKQFADPMTIILIVAAVISAVLTVYENLVKHESEFPSDVVIILAVVIINAVMGVIQESKAEAAIEALQEIAAATSKVIRDGRQITVKSEDLVPGDIIVLEAGDAVPADARIIECAGLKIEEAALTGESVPVTKQSEKIEGDNIPLGDRKNMVYMGSTVVYGRCNAVVTGTGMNTEMGKIADALTQAQQSKTPLQVKLAQLSRILTYLVIGVSVVIFVISLLMADKINFEIVLDTFMIAVSIAVAAIPEGLATVVTIVLSIGVTNMSKRNAIIRKMTAVETLGCTQIICSDKTGTLTQNKMTVTDCYGSDEFLTANAMSLCSNAEIDVETNTAVGEPTECALVNYAFKLGVDKNEQKQKYVRIGEIPFDSGRKMMTTVHKDENGAIVQFTKGAPDIILGKCSGIYDNGNIVPITDESKAIISSENKKMADSALRVLCVAMKLLDSEPKEYESEAMEKDLIFVGLVGMIDPVRPEVKPAIDECRMAGIRPIMITGDHKDTAVAIALQLGIIDDASQAITGAELDKISDEEFDTLVERYSVYARVQPEHKTRIVNAWRKKGRVTAMTGDGVNDAPSIKNADIGVGMGITGTDVTKNVADMILTDDNFATIVSAVGEGRRIYDNIRKAIQFLLSSNLSEVLLIFFATFMGFTLFQPQHLLWINLITDCFPALALGLEKAENNVMSRTPRKANEGIFADHLGFAVVYQGIFVTLITFASYFIGSKYLYAIHTANGAVAYTAAELGTSMAFITLSLCEIFHSFNMRSLHGSIFKMKSHNKWLWGAALASFIATTLVVEVPFLADMFDFARLDLTEYAIAFILAVSIIPLVEFVKFVYRQKNK